MNVDQDLVGKTITGVIANSVPGNGPREIWMLQFADGSHVEFVSPGARKALRRAVSKRSTSASGHIAEQDCLKPAANHTVHQPGRRSGQPLQPTKSRTMRYQPDLNAGVQLSLNVA